MSPSKFRHNNSALRASALTYFSLLSIVPVFAMIFGIAKGFGVAQMVEEQIRLNFASQEQVATLLISFSDAFLKHTKGGLVAGLGLVFLFWTVIKMLGQAEQALNEIWGVTRSRSLLRKFTDYLSLILVCPVLIILSSSLTVALTGALRPALAKVIGETYLDSLFGYLLQGFPLAILTLAFGFLFFFLPNIRVSFRAALVGGFTAALGYYLLQAGYVHFQVSMTKYNAIYGSFAALPLFLIWLQLSWIIILFGAHITFAQENRKGFLYEPDAQDASLNTRFRFAMMMTQRAMEQFDAGQKPKTLEELSADLKAPSHFLRKIAFDLCAAGVLSEVRQDDTAQNESKEEDPRYQPARPTAQLNEQTIFELLQSHGNESLLELNPALKSQ